MEYTVTDLMKAASMMSKKYFGRQSEYTISFTKEDDGCWYVDYPDWPFDHHNLMMVAGADELCAHLSDDGLETRVKVMPSTKRMQLEGYAELRRLDHSLTGGAHYEVLGIDGFTRKIWLCPVTLFVLGTYPAYIYLKKNV